MSNKEQGSSGGAPKRTSRSGHKEGSKGSPARSPSGEEGAEENRSKLSRVCHSIRKSASSKSKSGNTANNRKVGNGASSSASSNSSNVNGSSSSSKTVICIKGSNKGSKEISSEKTGAPAQNESLSASVPPAAIPGKVSEESVDASFSEPTANSELAESDDDSDSDDDITRQLARISRRMRDPGQSGASLVRYMDETDLRRHGGSFSGTV